MPPPLHQNPKFIQIFELQVLSAPKGLMNGKYLTLPRSVTSSRCQTPSPCPPKKKSTSPLFLSPILDMGKNCFPSLISSSNGQKRCPSIPLIPAPLSYDGETTPVPTPLLYISTSPYQEINSPLINTYFAPHLLHPHQHLLHFYLFFSLFPAPTRLPLHQLIPPTFCLSLLPPHLVASNPLILPSSSFLSDPTHIPFYFTV